MNKGGFPVRIICSVCINIISLNCCLGQENHISENSTYWFNYGFGISSYGVSTGGSVSFQNKNCLTSFRIIYNSEIDLRFIETRLYEKNPNRIYDIGLMQGFIIKKNHESASLSVGISVVNYVVRGKLLSCKGLNYTTCNYEMVNHTVVGIPAELEFFWKLKDVGIGVYGFANFNSASSYFGGLFCIQFSNLGFLLLIDKNTLK